MTRHAKENLSHDPTSEPRHIEEWDRPPEVKPGVTLAYKILTPSGSATVLLEGERRKLAEIDDAPTGRANETMVLIFSANVDMCIKNADVVWRAKLRNGETVVLINHVIDMPQMPPPSTGRVRFAKGKSREDLSGDSLRALVYSNDGNGHKLFIYAPVQSTRRT